MDHGAHTMALDTHTPSFSHPCLTSDFASKEDCDLADEAADSVPSETLCCKFHKKIYSSSIGCSETKQPPPHLDLSKNQKPKEQVKNKKVLKFETQNSYGFVYNSLIGIPRKHWLFLVVGFRG